MNILNYPDERKLAACRACRNCHYIKLGEGASCQCCNACSEFANFNGVIGLIDPDNSYVRKHLRCNSQYSGDLALGLYAVELDNGKEVRDNYD